ncbi:hypothetical protein GOEFS_109_00120 [Gordonia effusa NBRC 100432]|uniref:Uncharacterized protein n=1 Tax=Gordonia effusa NBRC 100432 TaxID=1077974 RepID=H0R5B6_9ACTN|nr:hypothetical protein GOEFS_109_00120 [Gordonia effusa NBRC 100432]
MWSIIDTGVKHTISHYPISAPNMVIDCEKAQVNLGRSRDRNYRTETWLDDVPTAELTQVRFANKGGSPSDFASPDRSAPSARSVREHCREQIREC